MYNLAKAYRSIENPLPIAESRIGKPAMVTLKIQPDCSTVHDTTLSGEHICAQPFRMWNRLRFHTFMQVSPIFQRRKSDANKQDFENKLNLTCQAQSTPKTIGILTKVFYTFGPNLAILAWTGPELSRGQASDWRTDWHTHTRTHTHRDAGDDNTRRPKLASGNKNENMETLSALQVLCDQGPVIRRAFPCYDVFMASPDQTFLGHIFAALSRCWTI